jgi:hypothetical protein
VTRDPFEEFEVDPEELRKQWGDPGEDDATATNPNGSDGGGWGDPDMGILRLRRRDPPALPIGVFGDYWGRWIVEAAQAAACPVDYVAQPLLASASALIGNARWAEAAPGWREPPHLWMGSVGDSGDGKSPGSDCLARGVIPLIEHRMIGDFPERYREWQAAAEADKIRTRKWISALDKADGDLLKVPPKPFPTAADVEPQKPCLRQNDITIEEVAAVLATAAPKGLLLTRDELVGWLDGMDSYNPAGRAFWIEAYGGRPYRVSRRKHSGHPIEIPHLVVAVCGGTQPERLAQLVAHADDGLLARIQWGWPEPIPFKTMCRDVSPSVKAKPETPAAATSRKLAPGATPPIRQPRLSR